MREIPRLAYEEVVNAADRLFLKCKSPKSYDKRLSNEIKKIARRHKLNPKQLERMYARGGKLEEEKQAKREFGKRFVLRFRLIQVKTPKSRWWIGQTVKGRRQRKRLQKFTKCRVMHIPHTQYVLVRAVDYDWFLNKEYPVRLLQMLDATVSVRMITTKRKRLKGWQYPVAGRWNVREVDSRKDAEKGEGFEDFAERIRKKKVHAVLEKVGERKGFKSYSVMGNPFSEEEDRKEAWLEDVYKCPVEGRSCPCGMFKSCEFLQDILKGHKREDGDV